MDITDYERTLLLWLDLETTGLSTDSEILEIGWAVEPLATHLAAARRPDAQSWPTLVRSELVAGTSVDAMLADGIVPEVMLMHTVSGLIADLRVAERNGTDIDRAAEHGLAVRMDIGDVLDEICDALDDACGLMPEGARIIMAGSGVCAYEGRLLHDRAEWQPLLHRLSHGWWDVGVMRRVMRALALSADAPRSVRHRAADDVAQARSESMAICQRLMVMSGVVRV